MSSTGALNAGGWFGCEGPCVTWTTASPIAACFCVVSLSDLHLHRYSNETSALWTLVHCEKCSLFTSQSPNVSEPTRVSEEGLVGKKVLARTEM